MGFFTVRALTALNKPRRLETPEVAMQCALLPSCGGELFLESTLSGVQRSMDLVFRNLSCRVQVPCKVGPCQALPGDRPVVVEPFSVTNSRTKSLIFLSFFIETSIYPREQKPSLSVLSEI